VLNSFRSRPPANQTRGRRDWGCTPRKNNEIHIDVSHSRPPLIKGNRLLHFEVNTVMLGNVGSHSCTII
jgi:hypothetical protein